MQNQQQFQVGSQSGTLSNNQTQNQNATTNSATGPWEASQPLLNRLLAEYGGQSTAVTPGQSAAASALTAGANALPQFGSDAAGVAQKLFGSDTSNQVGMLKGTLADYQGNVGRTASGAELDPYLTPGFSDALATVQNDITNRVKGVYAGSGRDPSGAGSFAKTLGRGVMEGVAPLIASQFNQNKTNQMNAAGQLFGAGQGTAGQITSQQQVPLANMIQGVGLLPQVNSAFLAPATAQASAADYAQSQPYGNLLRLLAPSMQLAGAGTQTSGTTSGMSNSATNGTTSGSSQQFGTGQGTTTQPQSTMGNILGGASTAIGLLSLLSDERAKEDIKPVGMLNDGQAIHRFRYKGDPRMHIGLLAQEVEGRVPDAVSEIGGLKVVDYERATAKAAKRAA